mmetsp:Transcript_23191/g.87784  ORF Transcript_23191/g.87784 Transcript_23191/m.87784 type:complete len:292 (-) Transcript_23191:1017-1892(-)
MKPPPPCRSTPQPRTEELGCCCCDAKRSIACGSGCGGIPRRCRLSATGRHCLVPPRPPLHRKLNSRMRVVVCDRKRCRHACQSSRAGGQPRGLRRGLFWPKQPRDFWRVEQGVESVPSAQPDCLQPLRQAVSRVANRGEPRIQAGREAVPHAGGVCREGGAHAALPRLRGHRQAARGHAQCALRLVAFTGGRLCPRGRGLAPQCWRTHNCACPAAEERGGKAVLGRRKLVLPKVSEGRNRKASASNGRSNADNLHPQLHRETHSILQLGARLRCRLADPLDKSMGNGRRPA